MRTNSNSRWLIYLAGLCVIMILMLVACAPAAAPTVVPTSAPTAAPTVAPTSAPVATKALPSLAPAQPSSIQGVVWQWTSMIAGGTTTTVPNPENYTIIFNTDGTMTGKADCNSFSGTYSLATGFTIQIHAVTRAFCGEASLDQQYLRLLGSVAAGGSDGAGGLALETAGGAQRMTFQNGGAATTAPASAPTNTIQGVIWQWMSVTNQTTKQTTTVPNPENYTITFNADYTFTGKADCNNIAGTYSQANGFKITLGPSTMAFCGENSLDQQYLQLLGSVAAGGPDGAGGLALETAGGEQRMMFKNGGAAPIDPTVYNQVPKTTTFAAGQCQVVLSALAPAYTSNTIGGVPSGQIAAGTYEVGVAAQYSASLWYGLNNVGTANYIHSAAVSSTTGNCTVNK